MLIEIAAYQEVVLIKFLLNCILKNVTYIPHYEFSNEIKPRYVKTKYKSRKTIPPDFYLDLNLPTRRFTVR